MTSTTGASDKDLSEAKEALAEAKEKVVELKAELKETLQKCSQMEGELGGMRESLKVLIGQ